MSSFRMDPDAVLDFKWDWSLWLADGETIATQTILPEGTVTVGAVTESAGEVTVWLSAPQGRPALTCRITTNQGRTDDRTIRLSVGER